MPRLPIVLASVFVLTAVARADRMGPYASPVERALRVPVVVVGKVTAVEKEPTDAPIYPGAAQKVAHTVVVVKVESNLAGADALTHIRVGFVTPAAEKGAGIRPGRGLNNPELKEGQEWLFFLTKSTDGKFYAIPYMTPPIETKAEGYEAQLASAKKVLAAVADPVKALKAEKAEDRFDAAVAIIYKSRALPEGSRGATETVALSADESRLILKALGGGAWKPAPASQTLNGYGAFAMLGLGAADGWKAPAIKPGEDFFEAMRGAFVTWLDGPGKEYRLKKLVLKKVEK
ncbi:MAG TPA: hypothetical protein VGE74_00330, partial [Gemmata sp.]